MDDSFQRRHSTFNTATARRNSKAGWKRSHVEICITAGSHRPAPDSRSCRCSDDRHAGQAGDEMTPLANYLLVSALLFSIGLAGALTRRNAILVLVGIELMLNAANLNFIAFWRYGPNPEALTGIMFAIFAIGVAAAEAAVGLALIISIYRHYKTTNMDEIDSMRG